MKLPITEGRKALDAVWREEDHEKMKKIEGMRLIISREHIQGDCGLYIFNHVMKEPWVYRQHVHQLYQHPIEFLEANSYKLVDSPQEKDIVAYIRRTQDVFFTDESCKVPHELIVGHWGIYTREGVQSKFCHSHVFHHPIEMVPSIWAEEAIFFRKNL